MSATNSSTPVESSEGAAARIDIESAASAGLLPPQILPTVGLEEVTAEGESNEGSNLADEERERRRSMRLRWMTGSLCLVVVCLSMVMSTSQGTRVHLPGIEAPLPELCTTKVIFGQPCPGCGMTRAFISIGHGRFLDAWFYNPASFLMFPLVVFQVPWQAIQWWRLKRRLPELPAVGIFPYGVVLLLLLIGQWIVGLVS